MFPEYRTLISRLKGHHPRFDSLFEQHNSLDHEIRHLEDIKSTQYSVKIIEMKQKKLGIKRKIQKILEQESQKHSY